MARQQAEAREALQNPTSPKQTGNPHLVDGYGPSVWTGNVAVVESTLADLSRRYQRELDPAAVDAADAIETTTRETAVDADFMQALVNPTAALL